MFAAILGFVQISFESVSSVVVRVTAFAVRLVNRNAVAEHNDWQVSIR